MMEGVAPSPQIAYTIFGERSVTLIPVAERLQLLSYYEGLVAQEERQEKSNRGERTGVYIRFRQAR